MNSWFVHGGFLIAERDAMNVARISDAAPLRRPAAADRGLR